MGAYANTESVQDHLSVHWPGYLLRLAGLVLGLLLMALGLFRGWTALVTFGAAVVIACAALLGIAFWALRLDAESGEYQTTEFLYQLSQTRPADKLAVIDLGLRHKAIVLSQHLTSGRLHAIDVYNPQLMPDEALARARRLAPHAITDPRLVWSDGNLTLLPLPDNSVSAVFLQDVLSELAQRGDQQLLLKEIKRVLEPNGRLLLAEQADTLINRLRPRSGTKLLRPPAYWSGLLREAGFELRREQALREQTICLRADVPSPYAGHQLALNLEFERR